MMAQFHSDVTVSHARELASRVALINVINSTCAFPDLRRLNVHCEKRAYISDTIKLYNGFCLIKLTFVDPFPLEN